MNYTETEAKVREATNDDAWGPTGKDSIALKRKRFVPSEKHSSTVVLRKSFYTFFFFLQIHFRYNNLFLCIRRNDAGAGSVYIHIRAVSGCYVDAVEAYVARKQAKLAAYVQGN